MRSRGPASRAKQALILMLAFAPGVANSAMLHLHPDSIIDQSYVLKQRREPFAFERMNWNEPPWRNRSGEPLQIVNTRVP
jgi:hypothetical protein